MPLIRQSWIDLYRLLFSFEGRLSRRPFWRGQLVLCVLMVVSHVVRTSGIFPLYASLLGFLLVVIVFVWCSLALQVKRAHDFGRSGFYIWHPIGTFRIAFDRGEPVANVWGAPPADSA